ncbi:MAG: hypothetical protein BroJett030_05020 [Alphaproteobacteria bacterium]|nr:MAG: hypothetical protein BroJett030_05020 [Alphaproteobacteria bacterium]
MAKRLVLIHGRAIKPAKADMEALARTAIGEGLRRAGRDDAAARFDAGAVPLDLVYYGDINNDIQAARRPKDRKALTAIDPVNGQPCFPIGPLRSAYERTRQIPAFTRARYRNLLREADDYRFLDEAADFASLIGALVTFGVLNTLMIRHATPDMAEYLTSHDTGSRVRARLQEKLQPALETGDDICLLAHSMGAIVGYDVLWKYSHYSEYAALRSLGRRVALFLTIGCPLGELGVRNNLLDGRYPEAEKYPRGFIGDWWNFHAEDDYIAHAEKMRVAFARMRSKGYVDDIRDRHVYNCWAYVDTQSGRLVANPHDFYGYLMNQEVGARIGQWLS